MQAVMRLVGIVLILAATLGGPVRADDTDLYMINPAIAQQRPNVLIIFDNTANWNPYFANDKAALVSLLNGLSDQFNVGLMFFNNPNNRTRYNDAESGVMVAAVRHMNAANRVVYANLFNSLDQNSDQGSSAPNYAGSMAEAWRYFTGQDATDGGMNESQRDYQGNTNGSKTYFNAIHALPDNALANGEARSYRSPRTDQCQKNFIIFISNGTPSPSEKNEPYDLAAQGGGTGTIVLGAPFFQDNFADEWARFMASHSLSSRPHVYTYTVSIDAANWTNHPADAIALLGSMAAHGKGKYFAVTNNAQAIIDALNAIFQEILSVNSVFASPTLPVNVHVRGQHLNQVYMGVFRPDAGASPRWPGNLKLYKMQLDSNGNPQMVDRNETPVYDAVNGFVSSTATSFWTSPTTSVTQLVSAGPPAEYRFGLYKFWDAGYYPDAQGSGVPPSGSRDGAADAPDGEMVEKGGAAQKLRGSLSYDAGNGRARVPDRRLYTCTGEACSRGASLSAMPFATSNPALTAAAFGLGSTVEISSLTRGDSTCTANSCISAVTAVTATPHDFGNNTSVTVSGASDPAFNGVATITVQGASTFAYSITETPAPSAAGSITASAVSGTPAAIARVDYSDSGSSRTVTLTAPGHGIDPGAGVSVTITGLSPAEYAGNHTVSAVDASVLAYTIPIVYSEQPGAGTTAFSAPYPSMTFYNSSTCTGTTAGSTSIGSVSRAAGSTSLAVAPATGSRTPNAAYTHVSLPAATGYGGCYACSSADNTRCRKNAGTTLTVSPASFSTAATPAPLLGSGASVGPAGVTQTVTALSRSGSSCATGACMATVTATVASSAGFAGKTAYISGASPADYNGSFAVAAVPDATHFTFAIPTRPASAATGASASSTTSGVTPAELIGWIRGQNIKSEDNPSLRTDDVRGYLHGDVLHSRPAIINYNRSGQAAARDLVVFYGANDGVLHAVKGGREDADGGELWGFIAPEHFTRFQRLYANAPLWTPTTPRSYFFDGPVSTLVKGNLDAGGAQRIEGEGAQALIFVGMRRGGRTYYAFDVTDPGTALAPAAPGFLWKIIGGAGDFAELGQTWSEAKVGKMNILGAEREVLIFGAGYDPAANDASPQSTATMGRGIFVVDAQTGERIWQVGPTSPATLVQAAMTCSIPADVALLDADGDGYLDRIYAVDTCGNVWRANVGAADPGDWAVARLFALGGEGADARKFLFPPSVVREDRYDLLLIGSGDREHPFDFAIANRFYALRDYKGKNDLATTAVADGDLCDFTSLAAAQGCDCPWTQGFRAADGWSSSNPDTRRGWKISFAGCSGEKTVSGAVTLAGTTVFSTNVPRGSTCLAADSSNQCSSGLGQARNYLIGYQCATPFADTNANGATELADRYTVDPAGGFAPTGTAVQTMDDRGRQLPPTVCIGPNCIKLGSPPSSRRHRIYWHMGIDGR